jgi:hypothetical protein
MWKESAIPMEEPKLNELVESIHRQRQLAKEALSEAKKIDNLLLAQVLKARPNHRDSLSGGTSI